MYKFQVTQFTNIKFDCPLSQVHLTYTVFCETGHSYLQVSGCQYTDTYTQCFVRQATLYLQVSGSKYRHTIFCETGHSYLQVSRCQYTDTYTQYYVTGHSYHQVSGCQYRHIHTVFCETGHSYLQVSGCQYTDTNTIFCETGHAYLQVSGCQYTDTYTQVFCETGHSYLQVSGCLCTDRRAQCFERQAMLTFRWLSVSTEIGMHVLWGRSLLFSGDWVSIHKQIYTMFCPICHSYLQVTWCQYREVIYSFYFS
jgi:hypothetical protein